MTLAGRSISSQPASQTRTFSGDSVDSTLKSTASKTDDELISPEIQAPEILSPQPTTPHKSRAAALEKLTTGSSSVSTRPAPSSRTPSGSAAPSREIESLKAKVKVLESKLAESRAKETELEHLKVERDKFKSILQKVEEKIKPQAMELSDLRKEREEAYKRFEGIEAELETLKDELDLAIVDREMAEEEAQIAKDELEARKSRLEELELEAEVLREENEELTAGASPEEKSTAGFLQLQKHNERLKEALLILRDKTIQDEEDYKDQIKSLEADLEDNADIKSKYEDSLANLAKAEAAVEDLKQQLDAAGDVEAMIEDLGAQNSDMEKQIEYLKVQIADLEDLKDINDELEINHIQNEKELQEEIDAREHALQDARRREGQLEEMIDDYEYTISRYRELVTTLQSDVEDMKASNTVTETETEKLQNRSRAMMDLNMKLQISTAKAQVKTIDLELRRLDAEEATKHLEILKLFLPDSYKEDKNSVLSFLKFKRLAFKASLLHGFIKERVTSQNHPTHEDEVFAGCDVLDKLTWVSAMSQRFVHVIGHCALEEFIKYDAVLYDLEPIERALNGYIDGLRRGDLKEKNCAADLQRTIAVLTDLAEKHMPSDLQSFADDVHMKTLMMQSNLESAATAFATIKMMVTRIIPIDDGDDLGNYFVRRTDTIISSTRSVKVIAGKAIRDLEDLKSRNLSLLPETFNAFEQGETQTQKLTKLARIYGMRLHELLHEEGRTEPHTFEEIQNSVHKATLEMFSSPDSDVFGTYLSTLRILTSQLSDLAAVCGDLGHTTEFETTPEPWFLRAKELEASKVTPPDIEEELRKAKEKLSEAHRTVALRDEDLSTSKLKIETIEARMRDANTKVSRMTALEQEIEAKVAESKALREELEKADRELRALEKDRDTWKEKAKDGHPITIDAADEDHARAVRGEVAIATAKEIDTLRQNIEDLQITVRYLRDSNRRARGRDQAGCEWLAEPLCPPPDPVIRRKEMVVQEGRDCLSELVKMVGRGRILQLSGQLSTNSSSQNILAWRPKKESSAYRASVLREQLEAWKAWADDVEAKGKLVRDSERAAIRADEARRRGAALLKVKLFDAEGNVIKGKVADARGGDGIRVEDAREWEALTSM